MTKSQKRTIEGIKKFIQVEYLDTMSSVEEIEPLTITEREKNVNISFTYRKSGILHGFLMYIGSHGGLSCWNGTKFVRKLVCIKL